MKPSQFSAELRRIAASIDNSNRPVRKLLANDLTKLLSSLESSNDGPTQVGPKNGMSPEEASTAIQNVAAKLAASKNPDPRLVVQDLEKILNKL